MRKRIFIFWCLTVATPSFADIGQALPVYTESQLFALFSTNSQLQKVKADDCQLLQDIEARAIRVESPAYQFLYGDMLAWGVCVSA